MRQKKVHNNPSHAVGYCRYSSENQSETSIEAQQKEVQRYAYDNGLVIVKWYIDKAQSGTNDNRKDFQQMIKDSKQRDFSKVLVYQFDRFARDKDDSVFYKFDLRKNGVKVVSVTERIDDSPEGRMMETVIEGMADYYSRDLARKTARGLKLNAEKCKVNGSLAYGYKLTPRLDSNGQPMFHAKGHALHDITLEPKQAEAVKIMFQMTLEGYKRCDIIDSLTNRGFKKSNGDVFTGTHIDSILRNIRYTGLYVYDSNKKRRMENSSIAPEIVKVENGLPRIISDDDYEAVQKLLSTRKHRPPTNAEENYLLTGKIFCSDCGEVFNGMRVKQHGKIYSYYKCIGQSNYVNGKRQNEYCHNNKVRKDDIESFVIEHIKKIVLHDKLVDQVLYEFNKYAQEIAVNNSMIDMLENQIKDYDKQINNITNILAQGHVIPTLIVKLESLDKAKRIALDNLARETKGTTNFTAKRQDIQRIFDKTHLILESGTADEKRAVLKNFVNKILVYKDKVEVYINLVPMTSCGSLDLDIDYGFGCEYKLSDLEQLDSEYNGTNLEELMAETQKKTEINSVFPCQPNFYQANNHWLPE